MSYRFRTGYGNIWWICADLCMINIFLMADYLVQLVTVQPAVK